MIRRRRSPSTAAQLIIMATSLFVLAWAFLGPSDAASGNTPTSDGTSTPSLPPSIDAGTTLDIEVPTIESAGTLEVLVVSAAGSTVSTVDIVDGVGTLSVGVPHTARAGQITLGFMFSDRPIFETIEVLPGTAGDLDINVGPTSIRRSETVMALGLLTDVWGNPVVDGTVLRTSITEGSSGTRVLELPTQRGLGVVELATDESERLTVAMDASPIFSSSVDVIVRAGAPLPFDLVLETTEPLVADARTTVELRSTLLTDESGSVVADGTNVVVQLSGPDGDGSIIGEVIDGIVHARFTAPTRPGVVTTSASIEGTTSNPLTLDVTPALDSFPVRLEMIDGQRHVVVGPVVEPEGGLLPNGTPVQIDDRTFGLIDGWVTAPLDPGSPVPTVSVLGVDGVIS
jgi:hypothetical protein